MSSFSVRPSRCFVSRLAFAALLVGCGAKTDLEVPRCEDDGGDCCVPRDEVCDDLDDDCDGVPDDGLRCFFLDGERIAAQETARCGADWYAYDAPDAQSANPEPDIRSADGTVVAFQSGPSCDAVSLAIITDVPLDETGGHLLATWTVTPAIAAAVSVSDEPSECVYDARTGNGTCDWTWMPCCTDGVLLGPFVADTCVRVTLSEERGVAPPVILDGAANRIVRAYGRPFELCAQIRAAVP